MASLQQTPWNPEDIERVSAVPKGNHTQIADTESIRAARLAVSQAVEPSSTPERSFSNRLETVTKGFLLLAVISIASVIGETTE